MLTIGDKDKQGNTLILGGWQADLLRTKTGKFIIGVKVLESEAEAVDTYNELNGTNHPTDYISRVFQPWYERVKKVNKEYKVPSRTHPEEFYRVKLDPLGNFSCNCPGFLYRNKCWHIEAVEELTST